MDQDVDKLKEGPPQGIPAALMRTCNECGLEKGVSQFDGSNRTCRKCLINKSRARMKKANKPADLIEKARVETVQAPAETVMACVDLIPTETKLAVEIGGQRIKLCRSCMREFLGI